MDKLRRKVKDLSFYLLQRTIWTYPFNPRKEIAFITAYYDIDKFITILFTKYIDHQDETLLKTQFSV